eukprot:scaffold670221_cov46-Prasinocladus_malaysianus.AAC.2
MDLASLEAWSALHGVLPALSQREALTSSHETLLECAFGRPSWQECMPPPAISSIDYRTLAAICL